MNRARPFGLDFQGISRKSVAWTRRRGAAMGRSPARWMADGRRGARARSATPRLGRSLALALGRRRPALMSAFLRRTDAGRDGKRPGGTSGLGVSAPWAPCTCPTGRACGVGSASGSGSARLPLPRQPTTLTVTPRIFSSAHARSAVTAGTRSRWAVARHARAPRERSRRFVLGR